MFKLKRCGILNINAMFYHVWVSIVPVFNCFFDYFMLNWQYSRQKRRFLKWDCLPCLENFDDKTFLCWMKNLTISLHISRFTPDGARICYGRLDDSSIVFPTFYFNKINFRTALFDTRPICSDKFKLLPIVTPRYFRSFWFLETVV